MESRNRQRQLYSWSEYIIPERTIRKLGPHPGPIPYQRHLSSRYILSELTAPQLNRAPTQQYPLGLREAQSYTWREYIPLRECTPMGIREIRAILPGRAQRRLSSKRLCPSGETCEAKRPPPDRHHQYFEWEGSRLGTPFEYTLCGY